MDPVIRDPRFLRRRPLLASALLAMCGAVPAIAASYPDHPVKLVVPYPPGGGGDTVARALAGRLSEQLGQALVVDNKAGANGVIGSAAAARSAADGYTLLLATDHQMSVNPSLQVNMGFDPVKDLIPIGQVIRFPFVLVVSPDLPVSDLDALVKYERARPGQINNATVGLASQPHLAAEIFARQAGLSLVHIPFKGMAPALTDVMSGQVQMLFATASAVEPLLKAGHLKAIAVSGERRLATLPQIPTLAESGMTGFQVTAWYGLYAPTGTPDPVIQKLGLALRSAVTHPDFVQKMAGQGLEAQYTDGKALASLMASDRVRWAQALEVMGIKPE
jgi:tripartite-type tricarboxylate transporter receptor subunit TctC